MAKAMATAIALATAATMAMAEGICYEENNGVVDNGSGRCKKQTTYVCSRCTHKKDGLQKQFWFCNPLIVDEEQVLR
jgi:hypothetical protein